MFPMINGDFPTNKKKVLQVVRASPKSLETLKGSISLATAPLVGAAEHYGLLTPPPLGRVAKNHAGHVVP